MVTASDAFSFVETFCDPIDGAVLVDFCHMLLNANEFVFLD